MANSLLSGNYLQKRGKTFFLVWSISLFFVALLILAVGWQFGNAGIAISTGVISLLLLTLALLFRQDEIAAVLCIVVHVYVDWYLGVRFLALGLILVLLLVRYLTRSEQRAWVLPRGRGCWLLLLCLAILPALHGYTLPDGVTYYLTIFFTPLLTFWLGSLLAQDTAHIRYLFKILAGFGTVLAILALIQAATGKLLFSSPRFDSYLAQVSDFQLTAKSAIHRTGIFFINPDTNGTFFAIMVFLPLSLFFTSATLRAKAFYFSEMLLIVLALLSTYSTGAWVASTAAFILFLALLGNMRARIFLLSLITVILAVLALFFSTQLSHQLQHLAATRDLIERFIGWQVAIRIIETFPLTGLGLGIFAYRYRAPAFRISSPYYRQLSHPHNSYLEVAAMGGLPVFLVFLTLLCLAMWWTWRNWKKAEDQTRLLLTGGIGVIVALSINSFGSNSWTIAPLAALGWLILGITSSSLLLYRLSRPIKEKQESDKQVQDLEYKKIPVR
ncbi:MAG TPA: O-antigen ligase family protein [Ktedonobacteraceae bacterium]|nr:O-antigen ligase family protein [Ktedonobacteraceae bacterium]